MGRTDFIDFRRVRSWREITTVSCTAESMQPTSASLSMQDPDGAVVRTVVGRRRVDAHARPFEMKNTMRSFGSGAMPVKAPVRAETCSPRRAGTAGRSRRELSSPAFTQEAPDMPAGWLVAGPPDGRPPEVRSRSRSPLSTNSPPPRPLSATPSVVGLTTTRLRQRQDRPAFYRYRSRPNRARGGRCLFEPPSRTRKRARARAREGRAGNPGLVYRNDANIKWPRADR